MGNQWLNRISPATWIIYGLAVDQMGENTDVLITPEGQATTVSAFLASYFGYEYSFRWCIHLTLSCLQHYFLKFPAPIKCYICQRTVCTPENRNGNQRKLCESA